MSSERKGLRIHLSSEESVLLRCFVMYRWLIFLKFSNFFDIRNLNSTLWKQYHLVPH